MAEQGLKLLDELSGVLVKQRYDILEESGILARVCFGSRRRFVVRISGMDDQEVITITRNFKCCALSLCCKLCDCSAYEVKVEAPVGSICGYIDTQCSFFDYCNISFIIKDNDLTPILKVRTKCCLCRCCPTPVRSFQIHRISDNSEIGVLKKEWAGVATEALTDADTFSLTFPQDLDVCMKALLLGCVFLLDFMFYERSKHVASIKLGK